MVHVLVQDRHVYNNSMNEHLSIALNHFDDHYSFKVVFIKHSLYIAYFEPRVLGTRMLGATLKAVCVKFMLT